MEDDPATDEAQLASFVHAFYSRVRADQLLGPVFNDSVHDWPRYLKTFEDIWSSVKFRTGQYTAHSIPEGLKHKQSITTELFRSWLTSWRDTAEELMRQSAAAVLQFKAAQMADHLQLASFFRAADLSRIGGRGSKASGRGAVAELLPYRSTPVFVQDTLPSALQAWHDIKSGVSSLTTVLEGHLKNHISRSAMQSSSHAHPRARSFSTTAFFDAFGRHEDASRFLRSETVFNEVLANQSTKELSCRNL